MLLVAQQPESIQRLGEEVHGLELLCAQLVVLHEGVVEGASTVQHVGFVLLVGTAVAIDGRAVLVDVVQEAVVVAARILACDRIDGETQRQRNPHEGVDGEPISPNAAHVVRGREVGIELVAAVAVLVVVRASGTIGAVECSRVQDAVVEMVGVARRSESHREAVGTQVRERAVMRALVQLPRPQAIDRIENRVLVAHVLGSLHEEQHGRQLHGLELQPLAEWTRVPCLAQQPSEHHAWLAASEIVVVHHEHHQHAQSQTLPFASRHRLVDEGSHTGSVFRTDQMAELLVQLGHPLCTSVGLATSLLNACHHEREHVVRRQPDLLLLAVLAGDRVLGQVQLLQAQWRLDEFQQSRARLQLLNKVQPRLGREGLLAVEAKHLSHDGPGRRSSLEASSQVVRQRVGLHALDLACEQLQKVGAERRLADGQQNACRIADGIVVRVNGVVLLCHLLQREAALGLEPTEQQLERHGLDQ